ncbi:sushi, von Willebrand factor type A, EGF and pentraxin domain-containing protein 1-like isoform X2 [Centruroides vittatus]|uniref:sushi, von Willebrand factor type A, EGF and pentraxin domain-containing protein 1-like isoform X2 n=1 Tax=Centruroides vittatus TaxID=120091 RepID=UPI00350F3639
MKNLILFLFLLGHCLMIVTQSQTFRINPRVALQNRLYHVSSKPRIQHLRHQVLSNNFQRDAVSSITRNNGNYVFERTGPRITQSVTSHRVRNNGNYNGNGNSLSPSYTRNGNHHLITVPVPRNSVTKITVPLKNLKLSGDRNHILSSRPVVSQSVHPSFSQNHFLSSNGYFHSYPNPSSNVYSPNYLYHSSMMNPSPQRHQVIVHIGTKRYPSLPETYVSPKNTYNFYPQSDSSKSSFNNGVYNNQFSNRNNFYIPDKPPLQNRIQNHHLLSFHNISQVPPRIVISSPTHYLPKSYNDWRSSLGTSALEKKPITPHTLRTNIKLSKSNSSLNSKDFIVKSDSANLLPMHVRPTVNNDIFENRRNTLIHVKVRHPQRYNRNSSRPVNPTHPPVIVRSSAVPRFFPNSPKIEYPPNCIRCPSDQTLIIEKGKSCATVTVPPVKACSRLTKTSGKMDVLLGIGPKPGSSVKEGAYMIQFHILKAGSKVKTCQFRINVKALKCPKIQNPKNGMIHCTNKGYWGSICNFVCEDGYALVGEPAVSCDGNKKLVLWNSSIPNCEISAVSCPPIQTPKNGYVDCTNYIHQGSICTFSCDEGYILVGETSTTCRGDKTFATWTSLLPTCERLRCPSIQTPENVNIQCTNKEYWGSVCSFICDEGYALIGKSSVSCEGSKHASWSASIPTCERLKCPSIQIPENVNVQCSDKEYWGSICSFVCDEGYELIGESSVLCEGNKHINWSASIPTCERLKCPSIQIPENANVQCTDEGYWGSICSFICDEGYVLIGESSISCKGNKHASWSAPIPICEALKCPTVQIPKNGNVQCTNNGYWRSICNFSCDDGYTLVGQPSILCKENGKHINWNSSIPTCEKLQTSELTTMQCRKPANPKNGLIHCLSGDQQMLASGTICRYLCDVGYEIPSHLIQFGVIMCIGQQWNTSNTIDCQSIQCPKPNEPENGYLSCDDVASEWSERGDTSVTNQPNYINGTKCHFNCKPNYIIPTSHLNKTTIECIAPYWNNSDFPQCLKKINPVQYKDDCRNQTIIAANKTLEITPPRFITASGKIVISNCSLNNNLEPGSYENYCEAEDPELRLFGNCSYTIDVKALECNRPPTINFSTVSCTSSNEDTYPVNTECHYNCSSGYVIPVSMKHLGTLICLPSAVWNVTELPECKKRIVPEPKKDACIDIEYETDDPSTIILKNPVFLTSEGKPAEVSCTLSHVLDHGIHENTCKAMDVELQTFASCKYTITVKDKGHTDSSTGRECDALKSPTNGYIECQNINGKYRCEVKCKVGYGFRSLYTLLQRGFIECNTTNGYWDFQQFHGLNNLPDCLGQLPSTSLQASVLFKAGVENCSDYIALNKMMTVIKESLLKRTIKHCFAVDCTDINYVCGEDKEKNNQAIETIWTLRATYLVEDYEDIENVSDAETNIEEILANTSKIVSKDETFKEELHSVGATLWQDSFDQSAFELVCPINGYVIDPGTDKCFECPSGTFEEDGRCKVCPGNHYQDRTGKTKCKACPRGTVSVAGSKSKSDCKALDQDYPLRSSRSARDQSSTELNYNTPCDSHPCNYGGTCILTKNSYVCLCKQGYAGTKCETIVCPENYCLNGGTCTSLHNNIVGCLCPKFYTGVRCEIKTDKSSLPHIT